MPWRAARRLSSRPSSWRPTTVTVRRSSERRSVIVAPLQRFVPFGDGCLAKLLDQPRPHFLSQFLRINMNGDRDATAHMPISRPASFIERMKSWFSRNAP